MGTADDFGGGGEEKIFVSVRLRPLNEKEIARNNTSDWECINHNTIIFKNGSLPMPERSMYPTAYTFDRVFRSDCSTRQVYEEAAKKVALSVVTGINSSVFAYGQTSSGKTFTMTGITEYALADIYDYIQKHTERDFLLKFSAMEIYNESVRDLLSADTTPLRLLDDPERGTIVEKLTEETVRDWDHVLELLSICEAQRQIGETSLNEASSRSHQIIRLTIDSSAREFLSKDNPSTLAASVNFVDLAGSERASQTLSAGTRLKEGCHINRSLLTLGTVIRKLSKGRNGHIPFRDSKLTRILQSSLGGNARTAIICTLSPARSHVEQSRNTLLFASCAKEVTTNAQVNVVLSDKALVKHLQRELARLESELKSPGPTFVPLDCAALLREKDLQIEKLEKEIVDLTLQRDVAHAQVQDLLRLVGDDGDSKIWVGLDEYPNLGEERSPDPEMTPILADPPSLDAHIGAFDSSQLSDGHSGSSCDDHYIHFPDFEESFFNNDVSPQVLIKTNSFGSDPGHDWEEIEKQSNGTSEEICKEVRCIETEDSYATSNKEPSQLSLEESTGISALEVVGNGDSLDQELLSAPSKENPDFSCSPPNYAVLSPEKPSQFMLSEDSISTRSYKLTRSRSCKANLMINTPSSWPDQIEKNENTPANCFEKEFIGRPEFSRKLSSLNYCEVEGLMRKVSHSFTGSDVADEPEAENGSTDVSFTSIDKHIAGPKDMVGDQHEKQVSNLEMELKDNAILKHVKDVGLDPMEDVSEILSDWPSEFTRLQREIIELWNACNVSLVHRSYFFLLFKGDPADSIYMQVELRRLSFLKETFSRGCQTVEDGRSLTPASSGKALRRERVVLSIEMKRKLSEENRESLYLKWGIGLNTKCRRLQLANRLWTKTGDMDHIANSAIVVAKIIGFIEPGKIPKEMFGLNFVPRRMNKSCSLKHKVISLL